MHDITIIRNVDKLGEAFIFFVMLSDEPQHILPTINQCIVNIHIVRNEAVGNMIII
jgi:hypothetical protein